MRAHTILLAFLAVALAAPADGLPLRKRDKGAVPVKPPPEDLAPAAAAIWPFPAPDPRAWWDEKRLQPPQAADPLAGRRLRKGERPPAIDNGIDPSTYRLWGLMPLQWQVLRGREMVLEIWVRPTLRLGVQQRVVRVTVRRDGNVFVQGRAGLACCEAGIGRRVGFDVELPAGSAAAFLALREHPLWATPRHVRVAEGGEAVDALCVNGMSYDLTLVVADRTRSLRRTCDDTEIGQVADALEPALRAAMGHEPRFDVLFPGGIDFSAARRSYQELLARGGTLRPSPDAAPGSAEEPATGERPDPALYSGQTWSSP